MRHSSLPSHIAHVINATAALTGMDALFVETIPVWPHVPAIFNAKTNVTDVIKLIEDNNINDKEKFIYTIALYNQRVQQDMEENGKVLIKKEKNNYKIKNMLFLIDKRTYVW